MKSDREITDLLLGAGLLSSLNLSAPAGHFARTALEKMIEINFPGKGIGEGLEALSAAGTAPAGETERISSLLKELAPHLQARNIYLPGFIQKKIRGLVETISSLYRAGGGLEIVTDPARLSEEDWRRLEAVLGDYVRKIREAGRVPIEEGDFEDLTALREKVQIWAPVLAGRFVEKGLQYKLDSISRVNKTSGYIWVAFISDFSTKKVEQGSYSLTFTPLHLRAGLEMGGRSRPWRENYYECLLEGEIDDILNDFARLDCSLFDTFWYFNIRASVSVRKYLADTNGEKEAAVRRIKKGSSRLSEESLYFWNLLLPGRLFAPEEFSRNKEATVGLIERIGEVTLRLLDRIRP